MGCCGDMNFLQIPGNIQQNFAPFVLNPSASINQAVASSPNVAGPPQKFTFRLASQDRDSSVGRLGMFPNSMLLASELFKQDISFSQCGLDLNGVLAALPSVQIREYFPDTRLDQTINFFSDMFAKIFHGKDFKNQTKDVKEDTDKDTSKSSQTLTDRLKNVVNAVLKTIEQRSFMDLLAPNDAPGNPGKNTDTIYSYVVKFPYMLYYTLQSCVTTNIYELPCVPSNNFLHSSDSGTKGWGNVGQRLVPDFAKNIPVVGKVIDTLFGNIGVNYTPWWDAKSGTETTAPSIELKFSLFNDSLDAAIVNFIFVNTIIQNNRWLQYHIFQKSPALYDVTIAGIGNYRACTGVFDVAYKGILREPSSEFFSKLEKHAGPRYDGKKLAKPSLVKIPDVYDVTLKFQSMLPPNFNAFIFNYMSEDLISLYSGTSSGDGVSQLSANGRSSNGGQNAFQSSGLEHFKKAVDEAMDAAVAAWNGG